MFETLSERFEAVFSKLRSRGRLSAGDVDVALSEIRTALLEADVNLDVVTSITSRIRDRAVGEETSKALNPAQQVVKIVLSELTASLGGERLAISYAAKPPTVVLLAGLQGAGKTTNAAKLAQWFLRQGRSPMLVGADLQRPAALQQLRTLGDRVGVTTFSDPDGPVQAASGSLLHAARTGRDVVIVDTAGRLAIDAEMMQQAKQISAAVNPDLTLLVVDAMTGQDAVVAARAFHESLALDGVILTKLDGDARGGAALSIKEVVGRPIAFASVGEKIEDFEPFHPDRMASRILGMGDVETLIDKAEAAFEAEEAEASAAKLLEGTFTFDDFLSTMQQVLKMGNLPSILGMMPGVPRELRNADIDDGRIGRITGMIHSMTAAERVQPEIIDASRRRRIAAGSGCKPADVKALVDQFKQMRNMVRGMSGMGAKRRRGTSKRGARRSGRSDRARNADGSRRRESARAVPKGTSRPAKSPLVLPGLETGDWPGLN